MSLTEKREHLEGLKEKTNNLNISKYNIRLLKNVLDKEYYRETNSENKSELYIRNLKQTIEKQLDLLLQNIDKNVKRISLFHDTIANFKMDIERELRDLKYK